MTKQNKAAKIAKMLKAKQSIRTIKRTLGVSESYIYAVKNKLTGVVNEAETLTEAVKAKIGEFIVVDGAKNAQEVDAVLNERATTYGSFVDVAQIAQEMKDTIRSALDEQNASLQADHQEALDMITSKIARIIRGNASHVDSWVDIAGYATLVADRLQGKVR